MSKASIILTLLIICFLLASCTISKEARFYKRTIDGNWLLKTVSTEGIMGKVKAQLFNEAELNCFIGSQWNFNDGNSLGKYSISKSANECVEVVRNIRWSIFETKDSPKLLQFKRLNEKLKVIDDGNGFRFTIVQLDKSAMQLKSTITFENRPASIIYNFARN